MPGSQLPPGPMHQIAEHMRHLATMLERYQPPAPEISMVWSDFDWSGPQVDEHLYETLRRKYFALMSLAGITDREMQFEVIEAILGRATRRLEPIISRKDLTTAELARLCQALTDWETIEGYAS